MEAQEDQPIEEKVTSRDPQIFEKGSSSGAGEIDRWILNKLLEIPDVAPCVARFLNSFQKILVYEGLLVLPAFTSLSWCFLLYSSTIYFPSTGRMCQISHIVLFPPLPLWLLNKRPRCVASAISWLNRGCDSAKVRQEFPPHFKSRHKRAIVEKETL